jgi:hypothetical protein
VVEGISAAGSSVLPFSLQWLSPVVQTEPSAFLPIEGGSPTTATECSHVPRRLYRSKWNPQSELRRTVSRQLGAIVGI